MKVYDIPDEDVIHSFVMRQEGETENLMSDGGSLMVKGREELAHWNGDIIEINNGISLYNPKREKEGVDWVLFLMYEIGKANLVYSQVRFYILYPSEGTIKPWIKIYKSPSGFIEDLSVRLDILSGLNKMLRRDNEELRNRGIISKIKRFFRRIE